MNQFKIEEYTINVCQDIFEWCDMFYEVSHEAVILNIEELTSTSMGFALLKEKEIWVYIPEGNKRDCYSSTIAHEIGHVIEGGFKKNPAPRMVKLREKKAEHYENYFKLVNKIIEHIEINYLNK